LIEHLIETTYFHTHQICSYIKTTFDVHYSVSGLNKWLHHNRFSYKHPKCVPHKFCADNQDDFVTKYESLKANMLGIINSLQQQKIFGGVLIIFLMLLCQVLVLR